MRGLQAYDGGQLPVVHQAIHVGGTFEGGIAHKAMCYMVRRKRLLRAKVKAVLRNQHETGIGPIIQALGPSVTESESDMVRKASIQVHQQPVEF